MCGVPFFEGIMEFVNCRVNWCFQEGDEIDPSNEPSGRIVVATVHGKAKDILLGERVALNLIARASGIATKYLNLSIRRAFITQMPQTEVHKRILQLAGYYCRHEKDNSRLSAC